MSIKNSNHKTTKYLSSQASSAVMETLPSPQSILQGDVLVHFSHPHHPLLLLNLPYIFTCMGCKDYGAGKRFRCVTCNYDLHEYCALAPPSIQPTNSSVHTQHQLVFQTKPGGLLRSRCDVCGKAIRGYSFRCGTCNFEIHPCCSKLRQDMNFPMHPHRVSLLPEAASSLTGAVGVGGGGGTGESAGLMCAECNRKRLGRVYKCGTCGYQIHAVCAKPTINGLYANGINKAPEKPSMLSTAARVASHVIYGFIGGLIEGIGEGIGEVLVDNKGKQRTLPRRTNSLRTS